MNVLASRSIKMSHLVANRKGMTLVEIMIVLVIIGSLMAILAKNFSGQLQKARVKQATIQINEIGKALIQFNTDCGFYPMTDQGLGALIQAPGGGRTCSNWGPEAYLKKMPKDPWGSDMTYTSDGNTYVLKSLGADKREGGEGYNADISSEDQSQ